VPQSEEDITEITEMTYNSDILNTLLLIFLTQFLAGIFTSWVPQSEEDIADKDRAGLKAYKVAVHEVRLQVCRV